MMTFSLRPPTPISNPLDTPVLSALSLSNSGILSTPLKYAENFIFGSFGKIHADFQKRNSRVIAGQILGNMPPIVTTEVKSLASVLTVAPRVDPSETFRDSPGCTYLIQPHQAAQKYQQMLCGRHAAYDKQHTPPRERRVLPAPYLLFCRPSEWSHLHPRDKLANRKSRLPRVADPPTYLTANRASSCRASHHAGLQ